MHKTMIIAVLAVALGLLAAAQSAAKSPDIRASAGPSMPIHCSRIVAGDSQTAATVGARHDGLQIAADSMCKDDCETTYKQCPASGKAESE